MCDGVVMVLCKLVCHFKGVTLNSRRYLTTNANTISISSPTSKTSCGTGCYNASRRFGEEENSTYALVLQRCMDSKGLSETKAVQAHMIKAGFYPNVYLQTNLLIAYARWNCVEYARQVFDEMPQRDLVSWNAMLTGYARHGNGERALTVFYEMHQTCIRMDHFTFGSVFRACASLVAIDQGKQLQGFAIKLGLESDVFVGTALVNFYAKCETRMENARQVFDRMYHRNVVSWSAMIAGYVHHGCGGETLRLLHLMQLEGVKPNEITFTSVVNACANVAALEQGKQVHASIIGNGYVYYDKLANALVDMYSKCGKLEYARQMFDKMLDRDVVSWNAMIAGYAQNGYAEEALKVFSEMQRSCISLNQFALSSILRVCAALPASEQGKQVHTQAIKTGFESEIFVASALVDMYPKCGSMEDASKVFDSMPDRDIVSWTAMMVGYAQNGYAAEALRLFCQMQDAGMKPNRFPIASVLSGCAGLGALEQGKQIHTHILKVGFDSDMFVDNALVDMYAKCGSIEEAQQLFDGMSDRDFVTWNAMIAGYAQNEHGEEALKLLHEMQWTNLKPNIYTFSSVPTACARLAAPESGQRVHAVVFGSVIKPNIVIGCTLVDMHAKWGILWMHADCLIICLNGMRFHGMGWY